MLREFAATTPLVLLPILAFFLFLTTFLIVVFRVARTPRAEIGVLERLPLSDEGEKR